VETLNHIIIYNFVFSSINNYCICNLYYMMNNVQMVTLHFNLNYICNNLFFCYALNLINTQKTTKLNLNTPWMAQKYKKTINIDYYCFLPSMNHSRFKEIQYMCQLLCLTCFNGLLIPIFDIPCHL